MFLGVPFLLFVLTSYALAINAPLILVLVVIRRRLLRRTSAGIVALGFAAAASYMLWRMEWFDVWRHGIPSIDYVLTAFGPYAAGTGAVGWWLGGRIVPRERAGQRPRILVRPSC